MTTAFIRIVFRLLIATERPPTRPVKKRVYLLTMLLKKCCVNGPEVGARSVLLAEVLWASIPLRH